MSDIGIEARTRQQVFQLLHPTRLGSVKQVLEKMGIEDLEKGGFQGYVVGGISVFLELFEYGGLSAYARGEKLLDVTVYGIVSASRNRKYREKLRESIVEEVKRLGMKGFSTVPGKYSVKVEFFMSDRRLSANDLDNLCKLVLDSLTATGVFDDREVYNLDLTKKASLREGVHIIVWNWHPDQLRL
jgi:Holliday junction resolvase RusA-like endonuclease